MNVLTTTWRQLVRRRLWPVALLLVAALAAIPVVFSRDAEVPVSPLDAVNVTTEAEDEIAEPIVAKVSTEDRSKRRRVLGARKDPFAPAPLTKAEKKAKAKAKAAEEKPSSDEPSDAPKDSGDGPSSSSGGGSAPPVVVEPEAPKKLYDAGTIVVRFGDANGMELERRVVPKLAPLPDDEFPLVVYMGLTKNGKKAKFLVDASIVAEGDGDCKPHPASCEIVELAVGETEFLEVTDPADDADADSEPNVLGTFQLDLVDIKRQGDDDVK